MAALASIFGSLLWLSLRTRPDISWAVSRLASLAATEPDETRNRLKQLMRYLRWTLDFAMVFSDHKNRQALMCTQMPAGLLQERNHTLVFALTIEET
eukprot:4668863-Amphidinium_carterae.1